MDGPASLIELAVFVQHRAHAAVGLACQHHVTGLQRARLDQHRGHGTAALVEARFDDQALGHGIHRRLQFQHLGLQQHLLQQFIDTLAGLCRDRHKRRGAPELFGHHVFHHQLLLHPLGIGTGLVDLVDRHHDRHTRRLGVLDGLFRLRHDAVIGRHHQNHDVGGLGAAGTHGGKRLVTRGIQEGHHAPRRLDMVGTDVLGDAAGFARCHLGTCGCNPAARSCHGRRDP
jgi:hypothetical protein